MGTPVWYVTTPIYYVNSVPHIGSAYTTILADVIARYRRLQGREVFFLTGTDEHGQKVADAAKARGLSPIEHCDEVQQRFRDAWKRLDVRYDDFVRTTEPRHTRVVTGVLTELHRRGELYTAEYEGWYDTSAEVFVTDKEIEERGLDRAKLRRISERNWFFRMGRWRDALRAHLDSHPDFVQPVSRRNEVLGFLAQDLGDLCISRPKERLSWGIPIPFDPAYVTYVWFDALLNYVSVPGHLSDEPRFARTWPADLHLIGKDILTTHTAYWGTMLLAMGLPLPRTVYAHGWWLVAGAKMSKSTGNVVDPLAYADTHGVDALRWFLLREMPVGQDAEFSDERFKSRYDGDLGSDWGNLLARTLTLIAKSCGERIPAPAHSGGGASEPRALAEKLAASIERHLDELTLHRLADEVMGVLRAGNRHIDATAPWKLAKDPARQGELFDALYTSAETVRIAASALLPILPTKAAETLRQLGAETPTSLAAGLAWGGLQPGALARRGENLFPRIEPTEAPGGAKSP